MKSAIYARQSADKRDSISIESQIDDCRAIAGDDPYIFSDKGYTGANLNRPSFSELMERVREGKISRIIIYRLDRISRSLLDFVNLTGELKKHGVSLVSKTEGFDTSSGASTVMLNILMMFAEMERNAIRQRVTDNYYARGRLGLYLGGAPPFGYIREPCTIHGILSHRLAEGTQACIVREIYERYVYGGMSLTGLSKWLYGQDVKSRAGKALSATSVRRILRNPVYVKADLAVYRYLRNCGAIITSDISEFDGVHGCISYSSPEERKASKFTSFEGEHITIGSHTGIIDSGLWLSAQAKRGKSVCANHSGETSWLQGLMKCACGYSLYTKKYKDRKYLCCRGRKMHICNEKHPVTCDELEKMLAPLIVERMRYLSLFAKEETGGEDMLKLIESDRRLELLAQQLCESDSAGAVVIEKKIRELKRERELLMPKHSKTQPEQDFDFAPLSFAQKKRLCTLLISRVEIGSGGIRLIWA